jgi:hypothetical protein
MPDGNVPVTFPVGMATQEELDGIANFVVKRLARTVVSQGQGGPTPIGPHDWHQSVHHRNTKIVEEEARPPASEPPTPKPVRPPQT